MIETDRLKNVVIFFQTILRFVLLRKIILISFLKKTNYNLPIQVNQKNVTLLNVYTENFVI